MEEMSLLDVAEAVQGELIAQGDLSQVNPTGGSIDTRSLNPGEIFFALQGEQTNGHHFVNRAFSKGASVAVVSRSWYREHSGEGPSGTLILTEAPDVALGELARVYRRRFKVPVVGITGSNGKTTTKDMAASVLKTRYRVLSTEGNLNTCLGVPLTILRFSTKHDVAVVEMGITERGGLKYLCKIADPTIGVITNIGPTHLEFLGSVEGVAKAKGELLDYLDESSMAILNLDDLLLSKELSKVKGRLLGFGIEKRCQFRGERLTLDKEGRGHFSLQSHFFNLQLPGWHNVYNALAAATVGAGLGVPVSKAALALGSFSSPKLRSQMLESGGIRLLNDVYNANPASMRAALKVLSSIKISERGRRVAVLGDMLELGPGAVDSHRKLGELAAGGVDALFAIGDLSGQVVCGGVNGGLPPEQCRNFANQNSLVDALKIFLHRDDLVLIKGSRGLAMEGIVAALGFKIE